MSEPSISSEHSGQTTGSPERAAQQLRGSALRFDLAAEAAQLRIERGWREGDRSANTLVKFPDFRVVLTALRAGGRLQEHQAAGRVTIHTLEGRLRLHVQGESTDLPADHLLALEQGVPHDVEALTDSVFLLTLAWPTGQDPA